MPRTLKLLLLLSSSLAVPNGANAAVRPVRQTPAANAQQPATTDADFERGKQLLARGDAQAATAAFKRAAERRKTDDEVWYQLGLALSLADKQKDARKAFEKAIKLRPDSAQAHAGLAYALLMLDKPRDAEREASRALGIAPQQAEAHYVIAVTRWREDKYREALAEAEAALRSNPDFPAAARLAADALLDAYFAEVSRQASLYPLGPGDGKDEVKLMSEKREPALAPFKLRMRELAERLEAFAAARPNDPAAAAWREQAETLRISGRRPGEPSPSNIYTATELTTKALITYKPEPGFTEKARQHDTSGVVRLRAVLRSDGSISNIVAIRRLPDGLTDRAIEAARKIRFRPATIDGRPVSQFVVLEYNFNIY